VFALILALAGAIAAPASSADQAFVHAIAGGDTKAVAALLDQDFTWTNVDGRMLDAAHVRQALPKPAIADQSAAQSMQYGYGNVGVVEVNAGKLHTLRVWVKRPAGWRLLVYQEVKSLDAPATVTPGAGKNCENPCGAVPYTPKTATEREVMEAYKSLEEAAMGGKAREWSEIAADEIALVSSNSDRVFDKPTRAAEISKATLGGVAPMSSGLALEVALPAEGGVTLYRDGAPVLALAKTRTARFEPKVPGAYRVEATHRGRPWIWSSALRVE
jgi:hypothetical protein